MFHSNAETVNLNPRLERDLPDIEFDEPDPSAVAAGRKVLEEMERRRQEERVELWNGVARP
jgi:hypothetical protein